ncbi:MAG: hypothetical protein JW900_10050 [Anaerolineae bacterium]|nr:hypothetical protein [Anaerolineae bacterium]
MSEENFAGRTLVTILAVVAIIAAFICLLFGVLFIWGAFSAEGEPRWIGVGVVTVGIGLALIAFAVGALVYLRSRRAGATAGQPQQIVQQIDLSGDIGMEKLKCRECGAELAKESVSVKEGAIFISCPYCGSTYQVVEEPKW